MIGLLLLSLAAFAPPAAPSTSMPGVEEQRAPVACKKCQSTGRAPCAAHDKAMCAREDAVLY
ncbi:MAG: hypothetical protein RIR65_2186, partial [Planctomycetota bacterium]